MPQEPSQYGDRDEMSRTHRHCPCGQGTYSIIKIMEREWLAIKAWWEMDCPICQENYRLYTVSGKYTLFENARKEYFWVLRIDYERMEHLKTQARQHADEIRSLARERHQIGVNVRKTPERIRITLSKRNIVDPEINDLLTQIDQIEGEIKALEKQFKTTGFQ